jgi:restriction system protein
VVELPNWVKLSQNIPDGVAHGLVCEDKKWTTSSQDLEGDAARRAKKSGSDTEEDREGNRETYQTRVESPFGRYEKSTEGETRETRKELLLVVALSRRYRKSRKVARRVRREEKKALLLMLAIVAAAFLLKRQTGLERGTHSDVGAVLAWLAIAAIAALVVVLLSRLALRAYVFSRAMQSAREHMDALVRKRGQLVQVDAYGKERLAKWQDEIAYFLAHQVEPSLRWYERHTFTRRRGRIAARIENLVSAEARMRPAPTSYDRRMDAVAFERFCASELERAGWSAHVTKGSGDQGVDVIAEKDGLRVVLQCKQYSTPVGNKAVQQALGAKMFERAQVAAVVTNSTYTPAAKALAGTAQVLLLHYSDLRELERWLPGIAAER